MLVGVPREIKEHEYRVGLTPASVRQLVTYRHDVIVEQGAGLGIGINDADYQAAGAHLVNSAEEVYKRANLIVKVKEPLTQEIGWLHENQILFSYLHLAPDQNLTRELLDSKCTAIAYETVTDNQGTLPLLAPMSEVAGRMSTQVGAACLEKVRGGRGVLLGGCIGVPPAKVVVLGGGVVGRNAARVAIGMGADTTILDKNISKLESLDMRFQGQLKTEYATVDAVENAIVTADLVIGAVLIPGASTPRLVSRSQLKNMKPGSVLVDVSIDQGGCFETSRATTHTNPSYIQENVVHYCVSNMPGAVPNTATFALNHATLPFVCALANKGWRQACIDDPHLKAGLNVHNGLLTYEAVSQAQKLPYKAANEVLGIN